MSKKRGISPLISTVLIIAFVIILFVSITAWVRRSALQPGMEVGEEKIATSLEAMSTDIIIERSEVSGNTVKLIISNQGSTEVTGIGVKLIGASGSDLRQITLDESLGELGMITEYVGFDRSKTGDLEKIEITPILSSGMAISAVKIKTNLEEDNSLIAYYAFNGDMTDQSGNNNDGSCTNPSCPILTTDKYGNPSNAYSFDGEDIIDVADNEILNITENGITMTSWFKPNVDVKNMGSIYPTLIYKRPWEVGGYFAGFVKSTGIVYVQYCWDGACTDIKSTTLFEANKWYHYVGIIDNSNLRLYINGILENDKSITNKIGSSSGTNLQIGQGFEGSIDEVKIYNRALSEDEIKANAMIS